jgi:NTP pyrophosphatase (non-canonical NTP hydrolase)
MQDDTTTISTLKSEVLKFRDERDWEKFHAPKDLAMSVAIEAGELMELFQWRDISAAEVKANPEMMERISEELADVLHYLLSMANVLGVDLAEAVAEKLERNRRKYPVEEFRGKAHRDKQFPS